MNGIAPSIGYNLGQLELRALRQTTNSFDRVVLLRPAAVTHHFDNNQLYIELAFTHGPTTPVAGTQTDETLYVTGPSPALAPPGWYMLFVVETDGTNRSPSVGVFVVVG